ncbi:MAG: tryptophan 2,3-dioxygenase [Flavobacteriales bacterium]|nr:tryptophan 2,3-dioxygenase [Flavobacteriales bacterium]|tara:strand:- start:16824 stop:17801 length:978 start_codon:yes stop_codon:yes gene_type:complete
MKDEKLLKKIAQLSEKYSATGQDIYSFLEGLLYSDYMGYWDYIHLDTLLSLQNPKTDFPDEQIFIIYHQITELYFKLCLSELEQINKNGKKILDSGEDLGWNEKLSVELFIDKLQRINRYIKHLIHSFEIMVSGMEKNQFLKFRMALLPSSGFQSVQYRMIEIRSTDIENLIAHKSSRNTQSINAKFENLYWKLGARDLKSGKKSYTLLQFEKKYQERLLKLANKAQNMNLWQKYISLSKVNQKNEKLIQLMREYDVNINVNWKLAHYKSAAKYLKKSHKDIAATGGTNWQKYLPPTFQKIIFYPKLWTTKAKQEWGKEWVKSII